VEAEIKQIKFKVCMVGEGAVGKTSLIKKFVSDDFEDRYITTLGTKVTKKEIKLKNPKNNELMEVRLLLWDILGQPGFRHLLKDAYFYGAQGIIAVCDITRKKTLPELEDWMETVEGISKGIPTVFLGNKCDLVDEQQIDLDDINDFASNYEKSAVYLSSAKTGENVELAFKTISEKILEENLDSIT
jgi:small GTP-binding protein